MVQYLIALFHRQKWIIPCFNHLSNFSYTCINQVMKIVMMTFSNNRQTYEKAHTFIENFHWKFDLFLHIHATDKNYHKVFVLSIRVHTGHVNTNDCFLVTYLVHLVFIVQIVCLLGTFITAILESAYLSCVSGFKPR